MKAEQRHLLKQVINSDQISNGRLNKTALLVVESIISGLEINRAGLWLIDKQLETLNAFVVIDQKAQTKDNTSRLTISQVPTFFSALKKLIPFSIDSNQGNGEYKELIQSYFTSHSIHSLLLIPIHIKGTLVAALFCENVDQTQRWNESDILFSELLADKITQTIAFNQANELTKELADLNRKFVKHDRTLKAIQTASIILVLFV